MVPLSGGSSALVDGFAAQQPNMKLCWFLISLWPSWCHIVTEIRINIGSCNGLSDGRPAAIVWTIVQLIISEVLWHSCEVNFTGNAQDIHPWYEFENSLKSIATSPRGQWVHNHWNEQLIGYEIVLHVLSKLIWVVIGSGNGLSDYWAPSHQLNQCRHILTNFSELWINIKNLSGKCIPTCLQDFTLAFLFRSQCVNSFTPGQN